MSVVVRFAPSPTGYLHIGGARTALFNYYFAKHHKGKFLLRIEDTDRERSTPEAVQAIYNGLEWLGLHHDGEALLQSQRAERHVEIAHELVKKGAAYYCYMTTEEMERERGLAELAGTQWHYDRRWRDRDPSEAPEGVQPTIRIKAPIGEGALTLSDAAQGDVTVKYEQLDDFILLRSDGTPTYMLAVVVDDHDMGVTHVIRGDDHLNNMFRQYVIYQGMGWDFPVHAHIPLIHGEDGKKLSKRKGAAAVEEYRDMGYLPEAMRNYLLRLGWSHGDDELISDDQAIEWFDVNGIGHSPSQLDFAKLKSVNSHYIKLKNTNDLYRELKPELQKIYGTINASQEERLLRGLEGLKQRAHTLVELAEQARFYVHDGVLPCDDKAIEKLESEHKNNILETSINLIHKQNSPLVDGKTFIDAVLEQTGLKMGQVGPVLRAALTGTLQSPDMTDIIGALGRDELLARLEAHLGKTQP